MTCEVDFLVAAVAQGHAQPRHLPLARRVVDDIAVDDERIHGARRRHPDLQPGIGVFRRLHLGVQRLDLRPIGQEPVTMESRGEHRRDQQDRQQQTNHPPLAPPRRGRQFDLDRRAADHRRRGRAWRRLFGHLKPRIDPVIAPDIGPGVAAGVAAGFEPKLGPCIEPQRLGRRQQDRRCGRLRCRSRRGGGFRDGGMDRGRFRGVVPQIAAIGAAHAPPGIAAERAVIDHESGIAGRTGNDHRGLTGHRWLCRSWRAGTGQNGWGGDDPGFAGICRSTASDCGR